MFLEAIFRDLAVAAGKLPVREPRPSRAPERASLPDGRKSEVAREKTERQECSKPTIHESPVKDRKCSSWTNVRRVRLVFETRGLSK